MDVMETLVELLTETRDMGIGFVVDNLISHGVTVQELDGCEYCKEDSEGFRRMFGAFSLVNPFHGKTWQIHAGKCKPREINFCPMCGRRLPQPPKGE
jgi:hypothetical protein